MEAKEDPPKAKSDEEKTKETKASLADFLRIYTYARPFDYLLLALCVLTAIASGVATPLMYVVFGKLVNNITDYAAPGQSSQSAFLHQINKNALYMVYIFIGKFIVGYISIFAVRISGLRISGAIRLAYLDALFREPVSHIDKLSPGKVSHRITSSANTIQLGISERLVILVQSLASIIGFYAVAFTYNAILTLMGSTILPVFLIIYGFALPFMLTNAAKVEKAKQQASAMAYEIFASIRTVKAYGAEGKLAHHHHDSVEMARKLEKKQAPVLGILLAPTNFAFLGCAAIVFWFGIRQFQRGHIDSVGSIITVYFTVLNGVMALSRILGPIMYISQAAAAASEMFATIRAEKPDMTGLRGYADDARKDITFKDVNFAYPSRAGVQVLHSLSVAFEAGKTTAIVGPSGSGKSTIVALLERWYDVGVKHEHNEIDQPADKSSPDDTVVKVDTSTSQTCSSGSVRIGDHNIRDFDARWWRTQIGLVQQEPFLFNDTIYNNVKYGLCGTRQWDETSEEEKRKMIQHACEEAYAHDFIMALPQGYDSQVGETGLRLSGGQRQRIAIARSIIKEPAILILDEATSALDVKSEQIVQKALDRVSKNRTTIVIAHRLSTIKKADKIVVLRSGSVVEEGTHDGLLSDETSTYSGLVRAQAVVSGAEQDDTHSDRKGADEVVLERQISEAAADEEHAISTDETSTKRSTLAAIRQLLWEQRHHWVVYALIIATAMAGGATYPINAWLFAQFIAAFTLPSVDEFVSRGNHWALIYFIIAMLSLVVFFVLGWSGCYSALSIGNDTRRQYLDLILLKPIPFFDREGSSPGTLTSRIADDSTKVQQLLGIELSFALVSVFNLVGSMIIAFIFGWKLTLVGFFVISPIILVAGFFRYRLEINFEKMAAEVYKDSSQFATEAIAAIRTVSSLTMEDMVYGRYEKLLDNHSRSAIKQAVPSCLLFSASDSVEIICTALIFWYGGILMSKNEYDPITFFIVFQAVVYSAATAGTFFSILPNIVDASAAAARILSYRSSSTTHTLPTRGSTTSLPPGSSGVGLDLSNVHFTYESRTKPVIAGLNMTILPGQFAAIVGPSGCGKSTVINLIERFYELDSGIICCDGSDISKLDMAEYRGIVSLVSQEPTLYEGTIKENVALSIRKNDGSGETEEEMMQRVQQACKDAQIHDHITSLPEGYDTMLGPKGISLSGGQKQRLSLARALLRHPRLLLLDEATSSLDTASEKLVQQAIEKIVREGRCTVVAVAHRLATIQGAYVIFVLGERGKVLERGRHEELCGMRGVYWTMVRGQALDR